MTSRTFQLAIRVAVDGAGKAKAELIELGQAGRQAADHLGAAGRDGGAALEQVGTAARTGATGIGAIGAATAGIGGMLAGAFAAQSILEFGSEVVRVTARMEGYDARLRTLTGSQTAAAEATRYLWETSDRLNMAFDATIGGYSRLLPLVQANVLTTDQARSILEGFGNVQAAIGASTEQLSLSLFGLSQALSSGIVHAEELNQVTESLPGLMQALDKAAGQVAGGFRRMVVDGKVTSEMLRDTLVNALKTYEGAAVAAANTLQAKWTELGNAWVRLLAALGAPLKTELSQAADDAIAVVNWVRKSVAGPTDQEQMAAIQDRLLRLDHLEAEARKGGVWANLEAGLAGVNNPQEGAALRRELQAQLAGLEDAARDAQYVAARRNQSEQAAQTKAATEQAAARAQAELAEIGPKLERGLASTAAEKIGAINRELDQTKAKLEALRKAGGDAGEVARQQAMAAAGAARQIADIQKADRIKAATPDAGDAALARLREERAALSMTVGARAAHEAVLRAEAQARQEGKALTDAQVQAIRKEAAALAEERAARAETVKVGKAATTERVRDLGVIRDLEQDLAGAGSKRDAAINAALQRLSDGATDEARRKVTALAGALYDQAEAQRESAKAAADAKAVIQEAGTASQNYEQRLTKLNGLLAAGAIDHATWSRAADAAYLKALDGAKDMTSGLERGWLRYKEAASDAASAAEQAFNNAVSGMEGAFTDFVKTGEVSFDRLAESVLEDLARIVWQTQIMGPISSALFGGASSGVGGALSGLFGGGEGGGVTAAATTIGPGTGYVYHAGGVVGAPGAPTREVPWGAWAGAPRYHRGGVAGIGPDEVPAILQRGEVVLPRGVAVGAPVAPASVKVEIIDQRSGGAAIQTSEGQSGDGQRVIRAIVADEVQQGLRNGQFDRPLRDAYGLRRQGF